MPAYLICRIRVTDPQRYDEYKRLTPAAIAKHGGRFIVRGGPVTTLEGPDEHDRVVVIEFPTMVRAKAFWDGPDYAAAKARVFGGGGAQILNRDDRLSLGMARPGRTILTFGLDPPRGDVPQKGHTDSTQA